MPLPYSLVLVIFLIFPVFDTLYAAEDLCSQELHLSSEQCALLRQTILPQTLPPADGNPYGDDIRAAQFGFRLFFDARLSAPKAGVSCATCHHPEHMFSEPKPFSKGVSEVDRNAPSLFNVARAKLHFWDGRATTLWSQPLITMEVPAEMATTRLQVSHFIYDVYRKRYEEIFGPMPQLSDGKRFPATGKPGVPEFDQMAPKDQEAINKVYSNIGKVLEAYDRKLAGGRSAYDRFLLGDSAALTSQQKQGLKVLVRSGCLNCHSGPLFSDSAFHNIGVPSPAGKPADLGRSRGSPQEAGTVSDGAFLTPSLRNLVQTNPYGHNGRFETLEEMIRFHVDPSFRKSVRGATAGAIDPRLQAISMSTGEEQALVDFLQHGLQGAPPVLPWAYWIGR